MAHYSTPHYMLKYGKSRSYVASLLATASELQPDLHSWIKYEKRMVDMNPTDLLFSIKQGVLEFNSISHLVVYPYGRANLHKVKQLELVFRAAQPEYHLKPVVLIMEYKE